MEANFGSTVSPSCDVLIYGFILMTSILSTVQSLPCSTLGRTLWQIDEA